VQKGADMKLLQQQQQVLGDLSQIEQQLSALPAADPENSALITELKSQKKAGEDAYLKIKNEIFTKNPEYAALQYPQPRTIKEVQSLIPDDRTVVLTYFTGDSSSALWAIKKDAYQLFILPDKHTLQEKIEVLRFAISDPAASNTSLFTMGSYNLYNDLIRPASDMIGEDDELIIIPDGILHYLPFEVLYSEAVDLEDVHQWADMPYLVLSNPLSYAPSASIWAGIIRERKKQADSFKASLLAFGDPVFSQTEGLLTSSGAYTKEADNGIFERLKYSAEEVGDIASLFADQNHDIYLRGDASEQNVKTNVGSGYRYIHFATHGLINERQPDFSALVFSRAEDAIEDGLLQAAEIFNLRLETDLVVLSACQTGLGKMVRGEGLIGLSRAFMYAGSPSVMVSLWRVSDQSTAILMKEFYTNLVEVEMHKSEALRQAQIEMIDDEQFAHPFYWAPFVLIGDYR
jgi:CHAT domain-containing protein